MRKRFLLSMLCGAVIGLSLGFSPTASADSSAPNTGKKEDPKAKAKTGAACKTNADCDQATNPQTCRDSKCQVEHYPPPST